MVIYRMSGEQADSFGDLGALLKVFIFKSHLKGKNLYLLYCFNSLASGGLPDPLIK